jgi:hypothetical protein
LEYDLILAVTRWSDEYILVISAANSGSSRDVD